MTLPGAWLMLPFGISLKRFAALQKKGGGGVSGRDMVLCVHPSGSQWVTLPGAQRMKLHLDLFNLIDMDKRSSHNILHTAFMKNLFKFIRGDGAAK